MWKTNFDQQMLVEASTVAGEEAATRNSVLSSTRVRQSILTERRSPRDTYCSQRYAAGGEAASTETPDVDCVPAQRSQRIIHYRDKTNTEVVDSDSGDLLKVPQPPPLSGKVNLCVLFIFVSSIPNVY